MKRKYNLSLSLVFKTATTWIFQTIKHEWTYINSLTTNTFKKFLLIFCKKRIQEKKDAIKFMYIQCVAKKLQKILCKDSFQMVKVHVYAKCVWQSHFLKLNIILFLLTNSVWICAPCVVKSRGCCWQTEQAWKIYNK